MLGASSFLPVILVILLVVVMLSFALGTQRNIRRGDRLLTWLQKGLPGLGRRTTLRWMGSSAVRLGIGQAKEPFREVEVVVVLEPRDVTVLWAWARARRRRDFLILRGTLEVPPRFELEAGDPRGWTGRDGLRRAGTDWDEADWDAGHVVVWHSRFSDASLVRPWWDALRDASGGVWRLSVRREPPHLEVHVLPPPDAAAPADRLIGAFTDLARQVGN